MSKAACQLVAMCAVLVPASVFLLAQTPNKPSSGANEMWGTVKGRVVFRPAVIPANPPIAAPRACRANGPVLKDELVVQPKNKGVRWCLVWLTGVDDPKGQKPIPIHPALARMEKSVVIDQPCCFFGPRVLGMREGQELVVKNSSFIAHNPDIQGGLLGPNVSFLIPPKGRFTVGKIKARFLPIMYTCSIHAWMKGYIGVFKHPYFAVTDADGNFEIKNAPAGKYRLMSWHERAGWVIINQKDYKDRGKVIGINAVGTTDVGKIPFEPVED